MNIAFIGLGHFGRAIASLAEYNGLAYDYAEAVEGRLLSRPADMVFLTVPTQFMRAALQQNSAQLGDRTIIVNASKGIEEKSHLMVHQIVREVGHFPNYYSLIGPSFAQGIVDRHPTVVSLGYKNPDHVTAVQKVLETPYFKVEPVKGYRALELASALKNLYAITCGYAYGLGYGPNTRARLITTGLNEFKTLAKGMRFADYEVMTPGVVGDLVLTCSSEQSRNFQYGAQLARSGGRVEPEHTVEGYHTSRSINALAKEFDVKMPLAALTSRIINREVRDAAAFAKFLTD